MPSRRRKRWRFPLSNPASINLRLFDRSSRCRRSGCFASREARLISGPFAASRFFRISGRPGALLAEQNCRSSSDNTEPLGGEACTSQRFQRTEVAEKRLRASSRHSICESFRSIWIPTAMSRMRTAVMREMRHSPFTGCRSPISSQVQERSSDTCQAPRIGHRRRQTA